MHGRSIKDSHAQLALLDAIIFFTIMIVLCSSLVAYVKLSETCRIDVCSGVESVDVTELLSVFLRASIGESVEIASNTDIEMTGRESMADVILVICDAKLSGIDESFFFPLPAMILDALVRICPSNILPHLIVLDLALTPSLRILAFEDGPCKAASTSAASQKIIGHENHELLIVLILEPALLPHDLDI